MCFCPRNFANLPLRGNCIEQCLSTFVFGKEPFGAFSIAHWNSCITAGHLYLQHYLTAQNNADDLPTTFRVWVSVRFWKRYFCCPSHLPPSLRVAQITGDHWGRIECEWDIQCSHSYPGLTNDPDCRWRRMMMLVQKPTKKKKKMLLLTLGDFQTLIRIISG